MDFFGVGLPELLVIVVLILIVVGPQRLPEVAAQSARFIRDFRRYTASITREISDALQDIEREYTATKEEWKDVGDTLQRESEAIEGEVTGAATAARGAPEGPRKAPPAEPGKVVSMDDAGARRRSTEAPPTGDRPTGAGGA